MKDLILAILSSFAAVLVVLIFVALAWYLLWTLFLKKFSIIRELLNSVKRNKEPSTPSKPKKTRKD